MKQEDIELVLNKYAADLDALQVEVAALGTAVRVLLDVCPDKQAAARRFGQVMSASQRAEMSAEQQAEHAARHEALLLRLAMQ